ncbi:hypothetical protein ACFFRR_009326 [Megaselia abdita]
MYRILLIIACLAYIIYGDCIVKLPEDIPKAEPLYLNTIRSGKQIKYSLIAPTNNTLRVKTNSLITLSCSGRRNFIFNTNRNFTTLLCRSGTIFQDESNYSVDIRQLNCTKIPESELRVSQSKCAHNRGYIYKVGFNVFQNVFLTNFKICYDNKSENTFYSENIINGAAIKYAVKESDRRVFKSDGMTKSTSQINTLYTKSNQKAVFENLFGKHQNYINNSMFLSRGHLTPDADFIFSYEQLSTYYYANVAPEFQSVNGGNWVRVENMVRTLAGDYGVNVQVFTGYYDNLVLDNNDIYLDNMRKIEVPKWFYKVIKNMKTNAAIVVITLNNPFAKLREIREFCPNICEKASLHNKNFKNIKRGYTFCCEVGTFTRIVNDLPTNFTSNGLLNCAFADKLFDE